MKYSVIIPVYNGAGTLERCLNSLAQSASDDIEIIIIDDGSIDQTAFVIKEYTAVHPNINIRYYHQQNAGVSVARNRGLAAAKGEYILFVDSDDYVNDSYFKLLDELQQNDLYVYGYCDQSGEKQNSTAYKQMEQAHDSERVLKTLLISRMIMQPWNKRFRRSIIEQHNIRFLEGISSGEDFAFCMCYALHCSDIKVSGKSLYIVDVSNQESLSRQYRPDLQRFLLASMNRIIQELNNTDIGQANRNDIKTILDYIHIRHGISCVAEQYSNTNHHNLSELIKIIQSFNHDSLRNSGSYCCSYHRVLRLFIDHHVYLPILAAAKYKGIQNCKRREKKKN